MTVPIHSTYPFEQLRAKGYKFHIEKNRTKVILKDGTIVYNNIRHIKRNYKINDVYGFDTETYKGTCRLLCRSDGNKKALYLDDYQSKVQFKKCLDFLFYKASNSHVWRFFYNIDFDYNAIIKLLLNIKLKKNKVNPFVYIMIDMLDKGIEVQYGNYKIEYIKEVMFTIKKAKMKVVITDFYRTLKMSLNKASKQFLQNDVKEKINASLLNKSNQYWIRKKKEIISYCIQDCILLKKLGLEFLKHLEKANVSIPRYLCSPASISKQHFRHKCLIPKIFPHNPLEVIQIAYDCYYGGRFEILKRGTFKEMYNYDVNSEYPKMISKLPSLKYGLWLYWNKQHKNNPITEYKTQDLDLTSLKENKLPKKKCFGYFNVKILLPDDNLISTIPIRKGIIRFPNGLFEKWCTWYDLDLIREHIIEIKEAYIYCPSKREYYPFKDEIYKLYKSKLQYKHKNEVMYLIFKLAMNSLYGCFFEIHKNKYIENKSYRISGILFNPIYASQITAFGRWKILKNVWTVKNKLIGFHTDSIISEIPLDNFLKIDDKLGHWTFEAKGKGYIINTGMYQINGIKKMIKTRGIPKKYIKDWFDFAINNKDLSIKEFEIKRMTKLGQSVRQYKNLNMINIMKDNKKSVNINSDKKRHWFNKFDNFEHTLNDNIESLPYIHVFNELLPNPLCYMGKHIA